MATPIGHLADLGGRAAQVLRACTLVAAEDTRVSRTLLESVGARAPMIAAHAHNEASAAERIVAHLARGEAVALISDAGTPGISDPGTRVVARARAAGFRVIPVPGPSAVVALLSVAGLPCDAWCFGGFLPARAKARDARIADWRDARAVQVFFEAPHRVAATLDALATVLGADRQLAIGRELTKRFEEVCVLTTGAARAWFDADPNRSRGEYVIALGAAPEPAARAPGDDAIGETTLNVGIDALLLALLEELPPSRAVRVAQRLSAQPHRALYARALALSGEPGTA